MKNESDVILPYVYIIKHKETQKLYIGSRTSATYIDILTKYKTSSHIVKLLLKDDPDAFEIVKIIECNSSEEAILLEDKLLKSVPRDKRKTDYININFSAGGAVIKSKTHIKISNGKETILYPKDMAIPDGWIKIKTVPPNQTGKKSLLNPQTGETLFEHPIKAPSGFVIRTEYEKEQRNLLPVKNIWITDNVNNRKISKQDSVPDGWRIGKTIKKFTKSTKKRTTGPTTGKIAVNNGVVVTYINPDDDLPDGFCIGTINTSKGTTGKQCYNNGVKNVMFKIDDEIPEGFVRGRLNINPQPDKRLTGMTNKFVVNNGQENLVLTKGESIPLGYTLGKLKVKNAS